MSNWNHMESPISWCQIYWWLRAMGHLTQQKTFKLLPPMRSGMPSTVFRSIFYPYRKKQHQFQLTDRQASLPPSTKRIQLSSCSESLGIRKGHGKTLSVTHRATVKLQGQNGEHAVNPNQAATHSIFQVLYVFINCVTIDDGYVFLGIYQGFSFCCIVEGFQQK